MKKTIVSLMCLAALGLASVQASAQVARTVVVEFQGPGGHSNGAYGRTSAVHAAGRALQQLKSVAVPGTMVVTGLGGGNSVNSIASDARYEVHLSATDSAALQTMVDHVAASAKAGVDAENAFRNVKDGDTVGGAPANIRVVVTPQ